MGYTSLYELTEKLKAEGKIKTEIPQPTHFLDGTPIPDGYFDRLQDFFDASNWVYENYVGDELNELEREMKGKTE